MRSTAAALSAFVDLLPAPARRAPEADVLGAALEQLKQRLDGEPISFSLSAHGTWSACSLTGEYSADADDIAELVKQLLAQV
jgi:hypothetical protein